VNPWGRDLAGRLDQSTIASEVLVGNPLGDPPERPLWVYLPPGYDAGDRRYPAVYVLQGYTGFVTKWANRSAYLPTYPEAIDEMFAAGRAPGCIVVFVDAWTRYGGSQFVDSPGTGRYHTYLCDEVVPFVDSNYRTLTGPYHRALQGHSSGGFGAMITAMLRPDVFGGFASHAGDTLYEHLYLPEFAKSARALRRYDGQVLAWWEDFQSRVAFTKPDDHTLLMLLGVTACFSADDDGTPVLPFDPSCGRVIDDVWERWLAWDPVRMVAGHADALRNLVAVWVDGGTSDEWYLDLGAAAIRSELEKVGVRDVRFELHEGRHSGNEWRYPLALDFLSTRIQ
jgi:S-formylglutathione hydrolase FrmB